MSLNVNEIIEAPILHFDTIDSTNNHAVRLIDADTAQAGLTIVAAEQTAGKGQRGNSWKGAPAESLLMSIVLKPLITADAQFSFNAAVAVAVADVLSGLNAKMDVKIKWPNDIIINAKKAVGILVENTFRGSQWSHAVIGVGINVLQDRFPEALPHATSLRIAGCDTITIEELLPLVREQIIRNTMSADLGSFLDRFNRQLFRKNELQAFTDGRQTWMVTVLGMNSDGQLVVKHHDGSTEAYTHGTASWVWPD